MEGLIEVIKTEAEIDPLALHDEEEKRPLSVEGNFLKVVFKEIKVEPSDQSYDLLSDIKYEENKVPSLHSVVKFEVEEESCAVKQEQLSDVSVQDDDLAERSVQVECREVDSLLGAAHKCGVCNQHCDDLEDHECTRPFKCDVCDKRFRNKKNVKVHMGCHTVMTDELEMDSEDSEHGDDPLALTRSEDINIRKKIFLPTCKTEIKQECEDSSSYLVSEVKCEGTPVHASFPTLKSELKEESCIVKEELMSEIKSEVQY
ncbi:uncharacterized protein [Periplaneta americana]|uniref:uncharacterized protein isoform X2 n=1 Tax=Periplaneta americana TaxID=6978 RepID=UPI0037E87CE4